MAINKIKKAKSPTGRPSKVKPAVNAFMRGEDTRGARPKPKVQKRRKRRATDAELIDAGRLKRRK